eukprot:g4701.t1
MSSTLSALADLFLLQPVRAVSSRNGVLAISSVTAAALVAKFLQARLRLVGRDEQLEIETATETLLISGPKVLLMPFILKSSRKKKALTLSKTEYVVVKNSLTGTTRVERGPKMLFLDAYDEVVNGGAKQMISLMKNEFVRLKDQTTGKIRVEVGEQGAVIPSPTEVFHDPPPGKRVALDLNASEYCKIEDKQTGELRIKKGPQLVFLSGYEEVISKPAKLKALDLKVFQYVRVVDRASGKQRIERGEQLLFPKTAYEDFILPVQSAVNIDEQTAVLVRNTRTGQQKLEVEKKLFFPENDEEIIEVRELVKLADYEACIVRGKSGKDEFFFGKNEQQRSFFVPPYSELVELTWSRGRRREYRDLRITKLDLRPMFMSFEFNCRTADNVELVLEGTLFWEIQDPVAMLKFTNDTTGDICNHARSQFIERVSRVTLQKFMSDFNKIAADVYGSGADNFYADRGCKIHSLEVTGYHCAEARTAEVLGQIIQETTNRMNRLQKQESESEVELRKIQGQIAEEEARKSLLAIQTENSNARAAMEGLSDVTKVNEFLEKLPKSLDMPTRISLWNVLRKREALAELGSGNAKLFFTPKDVNLSIESHEHTN